MPSREFLENEYDTVTLDRRCTYRHRYFGPRKDDGTRDVFFEAVPTWCKLYREELDTEVQLQSGSPVAVNNFTTRSYLMRYIDRAQPNDLLAFGDDLEYNERVDYVQAIGRRRWMVVRTSFIPLPFEPSTPPTVRERVKGWLGLS